MDSKTQLKIDVIAKVSARKITINNAAKLLNCSKRTIERYLNKYLTVGMKFAIHGNVGRPRIKMKRCRMTRSARRYAKEFKQEAVQLALKSPSVGDTAKELGIPPATLHTWIHELKKQGDVGAADEKTSKDIAALI